MHKLHDSNMMDIKLESESKGGGKCLLLPALAMIADKKTKQKI